MRDPTQQIISEADCAALGHIRCEDQTLEGDVIRVWCPRCGYDLIANDNEVAPDAGSD